MGVRLMEREETLETICAWCERLIHAGRAVDEQGRDCRSHGICPDCARVGLARFRATRESEVVCPFCRGAAPRKKYGYWAVPRGAYAELLRCPSPECRRWFAPLTPDVS